MTNIVKATLYAIAFLGVSIACKPDQASRADASSVVQAVPVTHGKTQAEPEKRLVSVSDQGVSGKLTYKSSTKELTLTLSHGYLVTGPSTMDPSSIVKHMILTSSDLSAAIRSAAKLSDIEDNLMEGVMIEFGTESRYGYWMVLNEQKIQYSGGMKKENVEFKTQSKTQLAGRINEDATSSGGPRIDATFDLTVFKAFDK